MYDNERKLADSLHANLLKLLASADTVLDVLQTVQSVDFQSVSTAVNQISDYLRAHRQNVTPEIAEVVSSWQVDTKELINSRLHNVTTFRDSWSGIMPGMEVPKELLEKIHTLESLLVVIDSVSNYSFNRDTLEGLLRGLPLDIGEGFRNSETDIESISGAVRQIVSHLDRCPGSEVDVVEPLLKDCLREVKTTLEERTSELQRYCEGWRKVVPDEEIPQRVASQLQTLDHISQVVSTLDNYSFDTRSAGLLDLKTSFSTTPSVTQEDLTPETAGSLVQVSAYEEFPEEDRSSSEPSLIQLLDVTRTNKALNTTQVEELPHENTSDAAPSISASTPVEVSPETERKFEVLFVDYKNHREFGFQVSYNEKCIAALILGLLVNPDLDGRFFCSDDVRAEVQGAISQSKVVLDPHTLREALFLLNSFDDVQVERGRRLACRCVPTLSSTTPTEALIEKLEKTLMFYETTPDVEQVDLQFFISRFIQGGLIESAEAIKLLVHLAPEFVHEYLRFGYCTLDDRLNTLDRPHNDEIAWRSARVLSREQRQIVAEQLIAYYHSKDPSSRDAHYIERLYRKDPIIRVDYYLPGEHSQVTYTFKNLMRTARGVPWKNSDDIFKSIEDELSRRD